VSSHSAHRTAGPPAAAPSSADRQDSTPLPWARQATAAEQRITTRARRMVEGLPSWEPLPPGEILVRRPSLS
jgi:hypothetical protein